MARYLNQDRGHLSVSLRIKRAVELEIYNSIHVILEIFKVTKKVEKNETRKRKSYKIVFQF